MKSFSAAVDDALLEERYNAIRKQLGMDAQVLMTMKIFQYGMLRGGLQF